VQPAIENNNNSSQLFCQAKAARHTAKSHQIMKIFILVIHFCQHETF